MTAWPLISPGDLLAAAGAALLVAAIFYAVISGPTERQVGAVIAVGWAASLAVQSLSGRLDPAEWIALVDAIVLGAFVVIFARSRRFWVGLIANLQLLILVISLTRLLRPSLSALHYLNAIGFASAAIAVVLIVGTRAERRRRSDEIAG